MTPSNSLNFIVKVVLASAALGAVIKYVIPQWSVSPSLGLALGLLVGPALLMAGLLWLQARPVDDQSDQP